MERDTLKVLRCAQVAALPEFVGMVLESGEAQPAEFLREAAMQQGAEPARMIGILKGLAQFSLPDERLIDALLNAGLSELADFDIQAALVETDRALQRAGAAEGALRERALARLIAADALNEAVAFSETSSERALTARFWYLALRTADRIGNDSAALKAAEALSATEIEDPSHLLNAGVILLRFGRARDVVTMIDTFASPSDHPQITRLKLDAQLRLGQSDEQSLATLRAAAVASPTDLRIADLEAQLLLNLDRPTEAIAAYQRLPQDRLNHTMRVRLGKAQQLAGEIDSAIETYAAVLGEAPDDSALRRKLVGLCVRAGHREMAQRLYGEGVSKWERTLAPGVAENVAAILGSESASAIPTPRALWFENALTAAGHPPQKDWREKAGQIARIDQFIVQYAQAYPNGVQNLTSLVDVTLQARATIEAGLALGKGAFIASAHVGLLYAGPIVLNQYGHAFAYVASIPDLGQPGVSNGLVSTSTNDLSGVGRRILRALRQNATVAIAIDGAGITSEETRPLFDKTIQLSDFTPRLAWRTGTPSYFPRITMESNRAQFQLNPLPMPAPDESEDSYAARWLDTYAEELARFLSEHPEAMRGTGGFWSRIIAA